MPKNARVFIHYGPYKSCWTVNYQTKRLEGLQNVLRKSGHTVELREILDWNAVQVWVNGELVFKCNIQDLDFGGDGWLDPLCSEAEDKVTKAF
ncbi:UPF0728 protein [Octopus bimaculoides]|uniref:Uncharacterized protein n=1 Tax=Octopus bimaculoides TaxID=37653 RepID=A0A0L8HKK3_OCTBM|nr:UPF0728 protein [Octopus bimaculoides]|eukprot:XP_014771662.1 PREDICTED: UPF0728 protein-like [Octopus bimaculoides]